MARPDPRSRAQSSGSPSEPAVDGTDLDGVGSDHTDLDDAALLAEIDAQIAAEDRDRRRVPDRLAGAVLLVGSIVGWLAALTLLVEKIHLLTDPDAQLLCDINPFISCGNVMSTWQASVFGFPNMALGLAGFAIMGASAALLLSRVALPRWYRLAILGGMTFAFAFVHFLAISSIFDIRALCPWCLIVWSMVAPMFFSTLAHAAESGIWGVLSRAVRVLRHWIVLTLAWYALVVVTIVLAFWPQWSAMLGL